MVYVVAGLIGLAFGAGDQYLGSLMSVGPWTETASLLSAPWLVLPFVFGCTQTNARRAAVVGLVATLTGLLGYFLMIMGPFEGGQTAFTGKEIAGLLSSNLRIILSGLVTGPLYGYLGYRWRTRRAWLSAVLVAGALCLEPAAEALAGRTVPGTSAVWAIEVVVGLAIGAYFALVGVAYRRSLAAPGEARP
jgi:hypothetical protein